MGLENDDKSLETLLSHGRDRSPTLRGSKLFLIHTPTIKIFKFITYKYIISEVITLN